MSGPYWDAQWNVVQGCTPASEGCAHCWARQMHERFYAEPFSDVRTLPDRLSKPLHWRKPRVVFVCNTSDLFHPDVPFEFIIDVFRIMAACPQHTFLLLTKRAERMQFFAPGLPCAWPNVWLGVTVENQARANERIPLLLQTPATHRWVSAEPLLGGVDLEGAFTRLGFDGVDQVIVGGESGPRPCHVEWIRSLRDQCRAAGVPCYVKQLGSWVVGEHKLNPRHRSGADPSEWPEDLRVRELAWRKS